MTNDLNAQEWPEAILKRLRTRPNSDTKKKIRQVDLAQWVGVDSRTIQQWENGERTPSINSLQRLIKVFLDEGIFLAGTEEQEASGLWQSVKHRNDTKPGMYREFPSFDPQWFAHIYEERTNTRIASSVLAQEQLLTAPFAVRSVQEALAIQTFEQRSRTGNLPAGLSSFIGRKVQIEQTRQLLLSSPLLTLTGPGGSGKTALAIQISSTLNDIYTDGIWLFEFAAVTDPLLLSHYILSTLGLKDQPDRTRMESILEYIQSKHILFIFDNCEHLIAESAELAESLLSMSPLLHILVTSQESLNLPGENIYRVPPLSIPSHTAALDQISAEALLQYEAVQLFIERTRAILPNYKISKESATLVARICQRLEGIPLAVELAAARMKVLTLEQIYERLSDLLGFLTAGKRTAAPRQQTLKAAIDWSYSLLSDKEQLLLRRLSVFTGGFSLESIEDICVYTGESNAGICTLLKEEILDLTASLVDKSLVSMERSCSKLTLRYYLLDTIKQYAQIKLSEHNQNSGCNWEEIHQLHAEFYLHFMEKAEKKFRSKDRDICLMQIRTEYANIRAALQWSYTHSGKTGIGLRIACSLYWYWLHEGTWHEGMLWLSRFLPLTGRNETNESTAKALHGKGILFLVQGNYEEAYAIALKSVGVARRLGNQSILATSIRLLTYITLSLGDTEEALVLAKESVQHARGYGDPWNLASSLNAYGNVLSAQGNHQTAAELFQESVILFEQTQDTWELSGPFRSLGYTSLHLGEYERAIQFFKKSISVSQIYQGNWVLSGGLEGLAISLCAVGAYREAAIMLGADEKYRQTLGAPIDSQYQDEYAATLATLQAELGSELFFQSWENGRSMTRDQMIAYSLES